MSTSATAQRVKIPNRRYGATTVVEWVNFDGSTREYVCTFSFGPMGRVSEVFVSATGKGASKVGSDEQAVVNDACIAISLLLQHGVPADALAKSFGENRTMAKPEERGPPSSPLGAIARVAAELDEQFREVEVKS